jgi:hypothetical protein
MAHIFYIRRYGRSAPSRQILFREPGTVRNSVWGILLFIEHLSGPDERLRKQLLFLSPE